MRRDLFCTFEKPVPEVYAAYRRSIEEVLNKKPECSPCHTLSFGLNMSFKFNINGGSCHVHLIPYGTGTAVGVRYSIAQLYGARYEAHCMAMTHYVEELLGVVSRSARLNINDFLKKENQITMDPSSVPTVAPVQESAPAPAPAPAGNPFKFCTQCGTKLDASAAFCTACGKKQ